MTVAGKEAEAEIRVTDRRRISLTDNEGGVSAAATAPSLKPSYVEELEARTQSAEQKVAEVQARFEQLRATLQREADELRQRLNRAADERTEVQKATFLADLLPARDNLQRAIEAAESRSPLAAVIDGLKGTAGSFDAALAASGAEPFSSLGERFDPAIHEAVDTMLVEPEAEGRITAEYSRGYRLGKRLLRPARVQVGRSKNRSENLSENQSG